MILMLCAIIQSSIYIIGSPKRSHLSLIPYLYHAHFEVITPLLNVTHIIRTLKWTVFMNLDVERPSLALVLHWCVIVANRVYPKLLNLDYDPIVHLVPFMYHNTTNELWN